MDGLGIPPSAKPEMANQETVDWGAEFPTSAERPDDSGVSTATILTSKLNALESVPVELANDICECAEGGRDKTGKLGELFGSTLVCRVGASPWFKGQSNESRHESSHWILALLLPL